MTDGNCLEHVYWISSEDATTISPKQTKISLAFRLKKTPTNNALPYIV